MYEFRADWANLRWQGLTKCLFHFVSLSRGTDETLCVPAVLMGSRKPHHILSTFKTQPLFVWSCRTCLERYRRCSLGHAVPVIACVLTLWFVLILGSFHFSLLCNTETGWNEFLPQGVCTLPQRWGEKLGHPAGSPSRDAAPLQQEEPHDGWGIWVGCPLDASPVRGSGQVLLGGSTPGKIQETLEGQCHMDGQGTPRDPPRSARQSRKGKSGSLYWGCRPCMPTLDK